MVCGMMPLSGQVAVVAGATRGAGRGIARALGEAGAAVYCTGRSARDNPSPYKRPETIEQTAEMIATAGGRAVAIRVDHTLESERSEHRLAHGLTAEAIEEFLAELAALIEPVEVHFQWRPQSRDPNDAMVLEAAINGRADALVTYNVADFAGPAERFRISVLRPGDLLKKVKP